MTLKSAIRHWRLKGLIQGALSMIPGGSWINDNLQLTFGDLKEFEKNISGKVEDWADIMSYLTAIDRNNVTDSTILEIGSGWYPTLPFCFVLAGARCVYTVDLNRHMNETLTFRMLRALEKHLDKIAERSRRSVRDVLETHRRLQQAPGLDQLLAAAKIIYQAPQDAAKLIGMPSCSLDLVYSNSVLEHVSPAAIPLLMRESWRLLKPDGLMVHAVACNDHYAHFDKTVSFVNYLQYSERQWHLWNNRLNYQNRLRAPDFIRFAQGSGFYIVHEARAFRPGTREALSRIRLARQFADYSSDDLAATTVDFVAAKSDANGISSQV